MSARFKALGLALWMVLAVLGGVVFWAELIGGQVWVALAGGVISAVATAGVVVIFMNIPKGE